MEPIFKTPYMRLREVEKLGISRTVIKNLQASGKKVMLKQCPEKSNSPFIVDTVELAKCLDKRMSGKLR